MLIFHYENEIESIVCMSECYRNSSISSERTSKNSVLFNSAQQFDWFSCLKKPWRNICIMRALKCCLILTIKLIKYLKSSLFGRRNQTHRVSSSTTFQFRRTGSVPGNTLSNQHWPIRCALFPIGVHCPSRSWSARINHESCARSDDYTARSMHQSDVKWHSHHYQDLRCWLKLFWSSEYAGQRGYNWSVFNELRCR